MGQSKGRGKGKATSNGTKLENEAIAEITGQLARRTDGRVWFDDWRERFRALGPTPKEFMLTLPELFRLDFDGNRYKVTIVGKPEDVNLQARNGGRMREQSSGKDKTDTSAGTLILSGFASLVLRRALVRYFRRIHNHVLARRLNAVGAIAAASFGCAGLYRARRQYEA